MKKINTKGFSAVEGILILVIVGILGFVGWYVVNAKKDTTKNEQSTASPAVVDTYKRTTTVPKDWKTYTNKTYKLSFAYPSDWFFIAKIPSEGDMGPEGVFQIDAGINNSKNAVQCQVICRSTQLSIGVYKQSIEKTLAYERMAAAEAQAVDLNEINIKTTSLTINGHQALKFDDPIQDSFVKSVYLISVNGYTYDCWLFVKDTKNAHSISQDTLTAFESIKID